MNNSWARNYPGEQNFSTLLYIHNITWYVIEIVSKLSCCRHLLEIAFFTSRILSTKKQID